MSAKARQNSKKPDAEAAAREAGPADLIAILWVVGVCAFFLRMTLQTVFTR